MGVYQKQTNLNKSQQGLTKLNKTVRFFTLIIREKRLNLVSLLGINP